MTTTSPTTLRSLASLLLLLAAGTLCALWALPTLGTNDPLWFWPRFAQRAERILVHHQGERLVLRPGEPGFEELNSALNRALSSIVGFNESQGLSEESLRDYYQRFWAVEYFYAQPVVIHSRFATGRPDTILVPLSGRHSGNLVFLGRGGRYHPGVLVVAGNEEIRAAARSLLTDSRRGRPP